MDGASRGAIAPQFASSFERTHAVRLAQKIDRMLSRQRAGLGRTAGCDDNGASFTVGAPGFLLSGSTQELRTANVVFMEGSPGVRIVR